MADALGMSLDDLISQNKSTHQRPRGRAPASGGGDHGPSRRFNTSAAAAPHLRRATSSFQLHAGYSAAQPRPPMDEPTKLYISNLDYGVSNEDIKELFSDVGHITRYSINYDRRGRSKGTAEVVFSRRSDALAAVRRYNNVRLDGRPMKIEVIGTIVEVPPPPTATFSFNQPPANFNMPFKSGRGRGGARGWPQDTGGSSGPRRGSAGGWSPSVGIDADMYILGEHARLTWKVSLH